MPRVPYWDCLKVDCKLIYLLFTCNIHPILCNLILIHLNYSIPDTVLFLSYWYKSKELPVRLSFFWSAYELTSIIGAFLAFGFLHIHTSTGKGQWRYLFALEGLITGCIGIFAAFYMPASPTQTPGGFRGKGWFSEREEKIMVNRVIRDDPSKGSMHNRQAITPITGRPLQIPKTNMIPRG